MKKIMIVILSVFLLLSVCGCQGKTEKLPVKVLIAPHFEIGEMTGDDPGEAQLFYEEYFKTCDIYPIAGGVTLRYNPENRAAMYITDCGKANAAVTTAAVLSDARFDFSDAYILAVGCAGGAAGNIVFGDVVLASAICDYDLGHTADIRELEGTDTGNLWFPSTDYDEAGCRKPDPDTVARAYALTKDIRLETTEVSRNMLARNFPGEAWAMRDPAVLVGTSVTSDNYWKGKYNHGKAVQVTEYYQCVDPYAMTEMEDVAIASAAGRFGLLDRMLAIRVSVNMDVFLDGANPESLWGQNTEFINAVSDTNAETLDIFAPAMGNLFSVGKAIIDSMLSGEF